MRKLFCALFFALPVSVWCQVYALKAEIRPETRSLKVAGTVQVSASKRLYFQLAKQMHDLRMAIVQPVKAELHPVMDGDNGLGTGNWSAELPEIASKTPVTLEFSYSGGEQTAFVFHIGAEGSYADGNDIAWYPEFGPATLLPKLRVAGVAAVTGSVAYTVPKEMEIMANGKPSTAVTSGDSKTISYVTDKPSSLGFVVDRFHVVRSQGRVPVSLYLKKEWPNEKQFIDGIRQVVGLLTSIYGHFPFPEFALVEVSDEAVKGAGFGGVGCAGFMISTTSYLQGGFNLAFFGHEIGHQWWGNEVSHASEKDGTSILDEAIAQYGSLYCVDHIEGPDAAERYRRDGYPGYVRTQCGSQYLAMHMAGLGHRLRDMDGSNLLAHELADEKGFLVFDQLRSELGDTVFHRGLQRVTSENAFRSITLKQFQDTIGKAARRDLSWFWEQWFDRTGAPTLSLDWKPDGSGVLRQTGQPYRLTVPIAVRFDDGTVATQRVDTSTATTPFHAAGRGRIAEMQIDPHFTLLHFTPELKAEAEASIPVAQATWAFSSGKGDSEARRLVEKGLAELKGADPYGVEFRLRYLHAQLLYRAKQNADAISEANRALQCPSRKAMLLGGCYQLLMYAYGAEKDLPAARSAAESAIVAERQLGIHTQISSSAESWLRDHP